MPVPVAMVVDGDVVAVHSYWTRDGSRIVTKATVRTPTGEDVVVTQRGGSVDGIAQITTPGPPLLRPGMKVAIAAHSDVDLSNNQHIVLDSVKVLAVPPGFVRSGRTELGNYFYWESGCVFITIDEAGTTAIPGDQEFPAIDAAIEEWKTQTASCSYIELRNDGRKAIEVRNDKINVIKFRDTPCQCMTAEGKPFTSWCTPPSEDEPQDCHSPNAAGLTTIIYVDGKPVERDGAIVDADIELNGVNFSITLEPEQTPKSNAVLRNTLTHELGHLLGLEHTCLAAGDPARIDGDGNSVPFCELVQDPKITEATMYPFQEDGETKKASLSADDIDGICRIYPPESDPGTCEPVDPPAGCCSTSGSERPEVVFLLAGATALLLRRRRKASTT